MNLFFNLIFVFIVFLLSSCTPVISKYSNSKNTYFLKHGYNTFHGKTTADRRSDLFSEMRNPKFYYFSKINSLGKNKSTNVLNKSVDTNYDNFLSRLEGLFSTRKRPDKVKERKKFIDCKRENSDLNQVKRQLILKYDILNKNFNPNSICNIDYLKIIQNPKSFQENKLKIKKILEDKASTFNLINNRIISVCDKLLETNKRYPILERNYLNIIYRIRNSSKNSSLALSLDNLYSLDMIIKNIPLLSPVVEPRITSYFGMRKLAKRKMKKHLGLDLVSKDNMIYSSASGVVEFVGYVSGYGNLVVIRHENSSTKYAHLSKIYVKMGEFVDQGELIGKEGATGNARGKHLHFEVIIKNVHVDPIDFIKYSIGRDYKLERMLYARKAYLLQKKLALLKKKKKVSIITKASSKKSNKKCVK